jgi:anti-sigma factor RsiW
MRIDEVTLRAYVDGELSPVERSRIEAVLGHNEALKLQADALQASRLPYRAAFDAQPLPPLPAALSQQLANLSAAAKVAPSSRVSPTQLQRPRWVSWLGGGLALAASFSAGVMVNATWFGAAQQPGGTDLTYSAATAAPTSPTAPRPWVAAIASYQALYVRDTVGRATDSADHAQSVLKQFESKEFAKLVVPDLVAAGLAFKRIQLLGFGDRQLVQMAYLPALGKPAALCVLRSDDLKDAPLTAQRMENLSIVTWQKNKLAYVLALDMPLEQALAIGKKLVAAEYPVLHRV